jgi:hypothetical protein
MSALSRTVRALRPHAVAIALAIVAIAIAWTYAATTLRRSTEMGLPLDDSYIALTYAKQIGSGRPLTYFDGSGYSAGATSLSWPAILAPMWTLGARGHALVWAAFVLCALLYAWCAVAVYRVARAIGDAKAAGGIDAKAAGGIDAKAAGGIDAKAGGGIDAKAAGGIDAKAAGGIDAKAAGGIDAKAAGGIDAKAGGGIDAKAAGGIDAKAGTRGTLFDAIGRESVGIVAGALVVSIAAFAWTALSGMEVALASALLLAVIAMLLARSSPSGSSPSGSSTSGSSTSGSSPSPSGVPSRWLIACLVVLALARPEAAILVGFVCVAHAIAHRRSRRAALLWLAPLIAPVLWLVANRLLAGHWMPSTAIAKSQWFQPGFELGAWASAFATNAGKLVRGLFWDPNSPLPQARLFGIVWLVGCVRVVWWAWPRGASARIAASMIVGAPIVWCALVLASSGLWTLHQYRYIAPVLPLLAIPVAVAVAPIARWTWSTRVTITVSVVIVVAVVWIGFLRHRVSAITYSQAVADTNAQVVKIGRYVRDKLPGARVLLHDAGAIAYYGDGPVVDMLGLVSDDTMGVAANGPGARFEYLESLPVEKRPTHVAYYPGWLGTQDFTGRLVMDTPWGLPFARERVVAGRNMELHEASWDHVGTGERLLRSTSGTSTSGTSTSGTSTSGTSTSGTSTSGTSPSGTSTSGTSEWRIVDRVDIADLASERAHAWTGALGVRGFAEPTTTWSFVARDVTEHGLVIDGGRLIRGGREAFTITRDTGKPAKLVLRTGGAAIAGQAPITKPVTLAVSIDGTKAGEIVVPVPSGRMVEVALALPAGSGRRITVTAGSPYRVFHWFVLQPAN